MTTSNAGPAACLQFGPRVLNPRPDWVQALLRHISPRGGAAQRTAVLRALHHATGGSDAGLAMADEWSRMISSYPGPEKLAEVWRSITHGPAAADGFGRLCQLTEEYGFDWQDICAATEPDFEAGEYSVIEVPEPPAPPEAKPGTALDRYSLTSRREEVARTAVDQVHVLDRLALAGQLTAIYGKPSIGKSLITMALLARSAESGRIDPRKCYYLDFDTDANGLLQKIDYAQVHGFHVLSDGYLDFNSRKFIEELDTLIGDGTAVGVTVVLDTTKQHVSLMDKERSSSFASRLRRFSKAGGTVIALGHTNKHPSADGKLVFAGTTDLVEQFDACHILSEVSVDTATRTRTVLFENFKARGLVAKRASYRYSVADGLGYRELLESVTPVDETELTQIQREGQVREDTPVIEAIAASIAAGVVAKMDLVGAAVARTGLSKRAVLDVLERYTGKDRTVHRWTFTVHARGEKRYALWNHSAGS